MGVTSVRQSVLLILVWVTLFDSAMVTVGSAECSCYTFHGQSLKTWSAARRLCKTKSGELVSMETVGEWEFIKTQIQSKTTDRNINEWWIGLRRTNDGNWTWLSNHSLTYDKWEKGSPKDDPQKLHVRMAKEYPAGTYGTFRNIRADVRRGTICEYEKQDCFSNCSVRWCDRGQTSTPSTSSKQLSVTIPTSRQTVIATTTTTTATTTTSTAIFEIPQGVDESNVKDKTSLVHKDCLPYPLLVVATFVSALGGLIVVSIAIFFLVQFILRKKKHHGSSGENELEEGEYEAIGMN